MDSMDAEKRRNQRRHWNEIQGRGVQCYRENLRSRFWGLTRVPFLVSHLVEKVERYSKQSKIQIEKTSHSEGNFLQTRELNNDLEIKNEELLREGDNEGGGSQQQDKLKVSREGGVAGKAPGTGGSDEDISSGQVERTEKPERARAAERAEAKRRDAEPVLRNKRSQCNEKTGHRNEEWTLVVAARESLSVAAKTQHNQN
ncbi:hypothetical protein MJT46_014419 [Ovis ammon polii x Ovis aries]|nr:hypothetical protein MJT46_014419 [Ovis ammon polii x Ovis aries]